jgi:MtaA/CmuA family methyltransferase
VRTVDLIERYGGKLCVIIGCRPGTEYAGCSDREVMESVDAKVASVKAFVEAHDPDIVNTIAGTTSEAESLGAVVTVHDEGSPTVDASPLRDLERDSLTPRALSDSPLCTRVIESIGRLSEAYPEKIVSAAVTGPLTVLGQIVGLQKLLMLLMDRPSRVRSLLEPVTGRIIEFAEAQRARGARYVSVSDPTESIISPTQMRETTLPSLKEIFRATELPNHLHVCGNTNHHIEILGASCAQAISVDTMVDMRRAAARVPADVAIIGNISTAGVLLSGTPEDVRRDTEAMMKDMRGIETYIPGTSCGMPRKTPRRNIQAFLETVRGNHR